MNQNRYLIRACCLCWFLAVAGGTSGDEPCRLQIDSHRGEILDARVLLPQPGTQPSAARAVFSHATPEQYQQQGLPYTGLHRRILVEPRLLASSPHISISTIGVPNQTDFVVLLASAAAGRVALQPCRIKLAAKPEVKPIPIEEADLSPAEILARLLYALGTSRGISPLEVMVEILRLQKEKPLQINESGIVFQLEEAMLNKQFLNGLNRLMTDSEKEALQAGFEKDPGFAVLMALFSSQGKELLARLLQAGAQNTGTVSHIDRQDYAQTDNTELIQNLIALQNSLVRVQGEASLEAMQQLTPVLPPSRSWFQQGVDWLHQWILLRRFWVGLSLVLGAFCLLLSVQMVRSLRTSKGN